LPRRVKLALVALVTLSFVGSAFGQFGHVTYISPDEKLQAVVIRTKKAEGYFHESRVEIRTADGDKVAIAAKSPFNFNWSHLPAEPSTDLG
jgi:hypothetical protein